MQTTGNTFPIAWNSGSCKCRKGFDVQWNSAKLVKVARKSQVFNLAGEVAPFTFEKPNRSYYPQSSAVKIYIAYDRT